MRVFLLFCLIYCFESSSLFSGIHGRTVQIHRKSRDYRAVVYSNSTHTAEQIEFKDDESETASGSIGSKEEIMTLEEMITILEKKIAILEKKISILELRETIKMTSIESNEHEPSLVTTNKSKEKELTLLLTSSKSSIENEGIITTSNESNEKETTLQTTSDSLEWDDTVFELSIQTQGTKDTLTVTTFSQESQVTIVTETTPATPNESKDEETYFPTILEETNEMSTIKVTSIEFNETESTTMAYMESNEQGRTLSIINEFNGNENTLDNLSIRSEEENNTSIELIETELETTSIPLEIEEVMTAMGVFKLSKETKRTDSNENGSRNKTLNETKSKPDDEENKFMSTGSGIIIEHIDFVQLRLSHISKRTSSDIIELRHIQSKEFKQNKIYKNEWMKAKKIYDDTKKDELFKSLNTTIVYSVPVEYHIALIAYTMEDTNLNDSDPALYSDFNKKTRDVCSGKDIDEYNYKSYFKFLLLAIENLGKEMNLRNENPFLYRGASNLFLLEVGQILTFQHFVSTSTNLKIAEDFAMKTLFEIQGKYDNNAISIKDHSIFGDEEEVLFSPFQIYQVESKHEGKYYTRYVLTRYELR